MDEVLDPTLSEEIDRLHAEHHRYAQRLEELIGKPYLSEDEAARQGPDLRARTAIAGHSIGLHNSGTQLPTLVPGNGSAG